MIRNLMVLSDGSEVFSGMPGKAAIRSVTLTKQVNPDQELMPGGVCAAMMEAEIFAPAGFSLQAGEEFTLFRVLEDGSRYQTGVFLAEQPIRKNNHLYQLIAYDRVGKLDKDLSQWLAELTGWPYRLQEFARMVCSQCGVTLLEGELPNGEYLVNAFSGQGITGRQIMAWVGQAAGRFCRATAEGCLEFAWWRPTNILIGPSDEEAPKVTESEGHVTVTSQSIEVAQENEAVILTSPLLTASDDGQGNVALTTRQQRYYYLGGLSYQDYRVAPVEKVQLRMSNEDIGAVWPDIPEAVNTLTITGNYLLASSQAAALEPVAETLYDICSSITYTPGSVTVSAQVPVEAGDIIHVMEPGGQVMTWYVMTRVQTGQRATLSCTGSPRRDSSWAMNTVSYKALYNKVLNLRMDVEGLKLENRDTAENTARLELDIQGISTEVSKQQQETQGLKQSVTQMKQNAESFSLEIQKIRDEGVAKVTTKTGYTLGEDGLRIAKSGQEMANRLDNTGMYVTRSGEVILQANAQGVVATDVSVRNYLVVGSHARFEDYTDGAGSQRTACFFI